MLTSVDVNERISNVENNNLTNCSLLLLGFADES